MSRADKTEAIHKSGNNCCQTVIVSFADQLDLPVETLRKIGAGFLAGMGTGEATCGALAGAQIVMGLKEYKGERLPGKAKALYQEFEKRCGATICKDLKKKTDGKPLCECDECIRNAVRILEEQYG